MKPAVRKNWRELSEAAAREQDPERLLELVEQLNRALEEQENEFKKQTSFQAMQKKPSAFTPSATL